MPFFERGDVNLFYTVEGNGPPVLLLHGYACDSHDWSFQIPFLVSLGLRVIALDQRGHGRSSAPPGNESYELKEFIADAVGLLKQLQTGPVILIAHSMGGVIASILTVEHPDVVKALVVAHPIYSGASPALFEMGKAMAVDPTKAPEMAENFFKKVMYTPNTPEWLKTWQVRRVLGTDPACLIGCFHGLEGVYLTVMGQNEECKTFLRKRKCPRLAMCTNAVPAAADWEKELGLQDGVDQVSTFNEGTFSHIVQSEEWNKILESWLRDQNLI
jgi:pimeloyl-ACP methyl ester carboxylesterase